MRRAQPKLTIGRSFVSQTFVAACCIVMVTQVCQADAIVQYSIYQRNLDEVGPEFSDSDATTPPAAAVIDKVVAFPLLQYDLELSAEQSDPTSLRTKSYLFVSPNGTDDPWYTVTATASAASSIIDTATVQDVAGASSGTLQFQWAVTGISRLQLTKVGFGGPLEIQSIVASTKLDSVIPGYSQNLLDITLNQPADSATGTSDTVLFNVPWSAGTPLDVHFDLTSEIELSLQNIENFGFEALLESDFANTASIAGVAIFDEDGQLLPTARLVSTGGFVYPTAVPEPGAWLLLTCVTLLVGSLKWLRSWR